MTWDAYNFAHEAKHLSHDEVGIGLHHLLGGLGDAANLGVGNSMLGSHVK